MSATRTVPSRRGRPWDEESVRSELTEFLDGWERWPTYEEFIQGGAKGLRDALYRIGGVEYWAREMGLPGGDRAPGGVRHWTDEAIRQTLAEFFGDREDWPKQREFDEAGLHALREALRHYGGPERWAKEMGVVLPPGMARSTARPRPPAEPTEKPPRMWPPWDEPRIARELEAFLRGRTEWPRHREFLEAGHKQLYGAVLRNGGTHKWARRMGVKWVKRYGGHSAYWTEDRVREQLTVFLAGRSYWPTSGEFARAGRTPLLSAVTRTGGVRWWAREFGLDRVRANNPRKSSRKHVKRPAAKKSKAIVRPWDEERIERTISPLVKELGRWPTKSEFRRAGLRAALSAVYDHGGSAYWQKRLGVGPSPFTGRVPSRTTWTEERIESELREFCKGRTSWPGHTEFLANGARGLYSAVCRHGGTEVWRKRLGLQ
ncbi:MAG TPA: hypothetical protein VMF09_07385 [Solirubrobacteraceae bacterium]|nr:hypothetical protein [Solirubrobacteraceae bacterium]